MAVNLGSFVDKNNLKTIWTKVVNKIKSEINNIDIGGRNYIIYGRISSYEPYNVVDGRLINYIKTTWNSSYTGNTFTIKVDGFTPPKGIWTVSGRIKVNGSIPTSKYFTSSANTYGSLVTKCDYDTTTGRFVITQTYPGNSDWILHCPTTRSSGSSDVVELFDLKFEKGNKATDWSLSPEDLDNNISLIRPNLLSGTKDWKYGKKDGTIQSDKYYNLSVLYYKNTSSAAYVDIALWSGLSVKASTEYTLSFYAKGTGKIISYFHPNNVQIGYSNKGITTTSQDGSIQHVLTSGWEKYVITWKTLSTISGNKNVLPVRTYKGTEVWVCGVKFEEGNGATAWCESSSETAIPKYSVATPTSNGLMSSSDKNKLDMFGNGYVTAGALSTINDGTIGIAATGEGVGTGPIGDYSHAEGHEARAIGYASHAEGGVRYLLQGVNRYMIDDKFASSGGEEIISMPVSYTVETNTSTQQKKYEVYAPAAVGTASHAEGVVSVASGIGAHSEGYLTHASGNYSHAEGSMAFATGDYSHAEGWGGVWGNNANGIASHVEGFQTNANGDYSHAEGCDTYANGDYSHAEGYNTYAKGDYSHTEGYHTQAVGNSSHAEGYESVANGDYSHAEGHEAKAIGYASHAEGGVRYLLQGVNRYMIDDKFASSGGEEIISMPVSYTVETNTSTQQKKYEVYAPAAVGTASHAEGVVSVASGIGSHSEGYRTMASGNYSHAEGSMAFANGDYSHAEGWGFTFCSIASGVASHVEGIETNANGEASHAEGFRTYADGDYSHAEGNESIAYKRYSHAEGIKTTANGEASHSEGNGTIADGDYSHAEGYKSVANGIASHAEGYSTRANGDHSHSEGIQTEASGIYSHAEGNNTHSKGANSHAEGAYTSASGNCSHSQGSYSSAVGSHSFSSGYCVSAANDYQTVLGKYNKTTSLSLFTIGNGTSTTDNSANAFRVDSNGYAYGKSFNTSGADYAEFFEWKDQNIQDEDRCGLFVTLDGEYIRIANSNDKYILGVVSANPSVLGDAYNGDNWNGIYEKDVFGRIQYHTVHIEEEKDENGVIIMEARDEVQPIISKNYNNQKAYYSREERTEWEPIGLLGKLIIIDDGTCEVNGYCKVADGGIGTKDDSETGYRVLSRLDENHIKILFR